MKNLNKFIISFLIVIAFLISCDNEDPQPTGFLIPIIEEPDPVEAGESIPGIIRDISSLELTKEMGVGWNLGNSFDVTDVDKTVWGNPLPDKSMIDAVKNIGFTTVRVPVTWYTHQNASNFSIDAEYMKSVQEIVNSAVRNKMFVIINAHHENSWVSINDANASQVESRLNSLWTQIATVFKDYGDSVIFEVLNEPRNGGTPNEWNGGTAAERSLLNNYNKTCVDAIRNTGGNNEKRHLMIPTYAASVVQSAMDDLTIPNDDPNIMISLHAYDPWPFAGEGNNQWGTDEDKQELTNLLDNIKTFWVDGQQRAVIMGEWGAVRKNDLAIREEYYSLYAKSCIERGLIPIVWDDGGDFGLLNRNTNTWNYQSLAERIVNAQ